jgi:copper(I)-binding protein
MTVTDAWAVAQEPAVAVYLTIENAAGDDRLVSASTDVAGRVSAMGADVVMRDGDTPEGSALDLPIPSGTTGLDPGATHVMLEQLTRPLEPGEHVTLRLEFENAGTITAPVEIVGWDDAVERIEAGAR